MPAGTKFLLFGFGIVLSFAYTLTWVLVTGKRWKKLIEREGKTRWFF